MTMIRTQYILWAFLLVLLAFDVWLAMNNTEHDTISAVVHNWGRRSWFVLFGLGVLAGHILWPIDDGRVALADAADLCDAETPKPASE
jgi:hypothetical protein